MGGGHAGFRVFPLLPLDPLCQSPIPSSFLSQSWARDPDVSGEG